MKRRRINGHVLTICGRSAATYAEQVRREAIEEQRGRLRYFELQAHMYPSYARLAEQARVNLARLEGKK